MLVFYFLFCLVSLEFGKANVFSVFLSATVFFQLKTFIIKKLTSERIGDKIIQL